eukprot:717675_1
MNFAEWGATAEGIITVDLANAGRWVDGHHMSTYCNAGRHHRHKDAELLEKGIEPAAFPEWKTPLEGTSTQAYRGQVSTSYRVHRCGCNWHKDYASTMTFM